VLADLPHHDPRDRYHWLDRIPDREKTLGFEAELGFGPRFAFLSRPSANPPNIDRCEPKISLPASRRHLPFLI
jgi:hypothetical protein